MVPALRVLDVATGTGEAATLAGSRVGTTGRVIGIDVSAPMLCIAAPKVAKQPVSLVLMDGQTLAFRDESFDAVVCQLGLMFLPHRATALREWMRVLRGGARLAVCVWAAPEHVPLFGILMDLHRPDVGGRAIYRAIARRPPPRLAFLVVTCYAHGRPTSGSPGPHRCRCWPRRSPSLSCERWCVGCLAEPDAIV